MFTLHDEISQDTFVRAGLPSPTFPAACANKDGLDYKIIQSRYTMKLDLMRKQSQTSYEKTLHLQPKKMCNNGKSPINPYSNKVYNHFNKVTKKRKKLHFGNFLRRNHQWIFNASSAIQTAK